MFMGLSLVPMDVVLALCFAWCGSASPAVPRTLSFEVSADFDLFNQGSAVKYFEDKFYEPGPESQKKPSLNEQELQEVEMLRQNAMENPVLALAAAQVLYMFGWFRHTGEIIRENVVAAAQLFERSIIVGNCSPEQPYESWHEGACDIRWMHALILYQWLGETEPDTTQKQLFVQQAAQLTHGMSQVSKYKEVSKVWASPSLVNFNSIIFPGKPSRPIWDTHELPLGTWLEENHHIFKEELEAMLNDPRDIYNQLMRIDPSREHLATPGGWDTLRIVRYHHWFEVFCEVAPKTCELIRSRPEINDCKFMNVNYVRLNPGTHLKPHYGNGPRLSAHLSVLAPEPTKAGMSVGDRKMLWVEGKAILFDDTYPHMVSHWGKLPRYVMLVWFCHPCDNGNPHKQICPDK